MYSVPTNSQIIPISAIDSAISADMLSARVGSEEIMRPGIRCRPGNTARSSTRSPRHTMKLDPSSPRMRLSMGLKDIEQWGVVALQRRCTTPACPTKVKLGSVGVLCRGPGHAVATSQIAEAIPLIHNQVD